MTTYFSPFRLAALAVLLLLGWAQLPAQEFFLGQPLVTTCGGTLLPPSANQPIDTVYATLVCPVQAGGWEHVQLQFADLRLEAGDELRFYDGTNANATEITPVYGIQNGIPLEVKAGAINTGGCLYVVFRPANPNTLATRWRAGISCVPPCQRIANDITTVADFTPGQQAYIHTCGAGSIAFSCTPSFPQNGAFYQQSAATSTYTWQVDGTAVGQGRDFVLPFDRARGIYSLRVGVTTHDAFGCSQTDVLPVLVTVSDSVAIRQVPLTTDLCVGDTLTLFTSQGGASELPGVVLLAPDSLAVRIRQTPLQAGQLLIPASSNIPIESKIRIENAPGVLALDGASIFRGISINMEHTYAGDLSIVLTCPSGQSTNILAFPNGLGGINFGEPLVVGTIGEVENICAGTGYDYRFLPDATNGTLLAYRPNAPTYTYTTQPCELDNNTYTYTDVHFPAGDYQPQFLFNGLEGCPLSGEWTLTVRDNLAADNGYLFYWQILLDEAAAELPQVPVIPDTWSWDHPAIVAQTADSVQLAITEPGAWAVPFRVTDNLGCTATTLYTFDVLPTNHPDCMVVGTEDLTTTTTGWEVFPNPFGSHLTLRPVQAGQPYQYRIVDATGRTLHGGQSAGTLLLDTTLWPAGIYHLQLWDTASGASVAKTLVRSR